MPSSAVKPPLEWERNGPQYVAAYSTRKRIQIYRRRDGSPVAGAPYLQRFGHVYHDSGVWHAMGTTFDQCRDFATLEEAKMYIEALYALD